MRHLITGCLTALFVLVGCGPATGKLKGPSLHVQSKGFYINTHSVNSHIFRVTKEAADILNREVFQSSPACPRIIVQTSTLGTDPSFPAGINLYDQKVLAGYKTPNNCQDPYSAIAKDGSFAIINLCQKRITDATWSHYVDPMIYVVMNGLTKVLGLPTTQSWKGVASYSANDERIRAERGIRMMFRFRESEKQALRKRYCREVRTSQKL